MSATQVNGQGGYAVTVQVTDSSSPVPGIATTTLDFGVNSDSTYGGCQIFPPDSIYNLRIDSLPVDSNPADQIPADLLANPLHPDFGGGFYPGPGGIPFMRVPANQPAANVNLANGAQIDPAGAYQWPFPAWPNAAIEGTNYGLDGGDHHILILQSSVNNVSGPQTGSCTLYETYSSAAVPGLYDTGSNTWSLSVASTYDLNSDRIASSEDALDQGGQDSDGIPILPLLVKYSEVPLGVQHPLRINFPSPTNGFVWPATGCCAGSGPPQGLLYRLKSDVNWQATCPVSTNPQAATVLQALQQYGAYMSNHNTAGFIQGAPDVRWNDSDLACIGNFPVSDLEVVDNSVLEVSDISGQTEPYVVPAALPDGAVGAPYAAALEAVGGNPATLQWSLASGALPPGLLLNGSTGAISGTPSSTAGSPYGFALTATDTASGYASRGQAFAIQVAPPTLVSIAVTPANPSIAKGLTQQFTATGTYSDTSTRNLTSQVTWATATTTTATISVGGIVSGAGVGASTISATLGAVSGSTLLTVTAATLVSIAVTPANPSIAKGLTQQFTATGTYTDGSTLNLTNSVTWASGTAGAATISTTGLATAVEASGTSAITATSGAVQGLTTLTATAAALVSIAVTPANPSIAKGLTHQFTATGTYTDSSSQNLTGSVSWNSASITVASITTTGLATAVGQGSSNITASQNGVTSPVEVLTVTAATLQSLAVTPPNLSVVVGTVQQFQAVGTYTDGSTQNLTGQVTWGSTIATVATISTVGNAVGLKVGATTISATLGSVSGSTSLALTPLGPCDVTGQGFYAVVDVQAMINEALGVASVINDLSGDGAVNVLDVQIVADAVLGLGCTASPGNSLVASVTAGHGPNVIPQ